MQTGNIQFGHNGGFPHLASPSLGTPQYTSEQIQALINQGIQQALQQHGLVAPPIDMKAFGEEVLVSFGDNLTQQDAMYFTANLKRFVPFIKSEQGKELSTMLIEEFKAYK